MRSASSVANVAVGRADGGRLAAVPEGRGAVRRRQLLESAVAVVAGGGLRGLTHRAVDARSGFPEGTTSAHFRTRLALLSALADHVAARTSDDVDTLASSLIGHSGDHEYAIAATQVLIDSWLAEWRLLATRLELSIEAGRQPELADTLGRWRDHLLDVVQMRLCEGGHDDTRLRAQTVVAGLDGVLMAALGVPAAQRRELTMRSTQLLLGSLLAQPGQ